MRPFGRNLQSRRGEQPRQESNLRVALEGGASCSTRRRGHDKGYLRWGAGNLPPRQIRARNGPRSAHGRRVPKNGVCQGRSLLWEPPFASGQESGTRIG